MRICKWLIILKKNSLKSVRNCQRRTVKMNQDSSVAFMDVKNKKKNLTNILAPILISLILAVT